MSSTSPMPIIDSGSHWAEPPDTWVSRASAKFRDRVPRLERHPDGYDVWLVDGDNFFARFGFSVVKTGREKVFGETALPRYEDSDPSASLPRECVAPLPEASQRHLLYENAMELYRFPESAIQAVAADTREVLAPE